MIVLVLDSFDGSFWAGAGTTIAILLIGHWLPWSLPRIGAYVYGTASILLGILVWMLSQGLLEEAIGVCLIALAGGVAVLGAYGLDWCIKYIKMGMKGERMMRDGDTRPE